MKKFSGRIIMAIGIGLICCASAFAYKVNDKVKVEWKGALYPATILKIDNNKYLIHYDDYASSWDEWVTENRIKSSTAPEYNVGDSVRVNWKGSWYPATVLKVNNNKYLIHYNGYGSNWDEWVGSGRIKK